MPDSKNAPAVVVDFKPETILAAYQAVSQNPEVKHLMTDFAIAYRDKTPENAGTPEDQLFGELAAQAVLMQYCLQQNRLTPEEIAGVFYLGYNQSRVKLSPAMAAEMLSEWVNTPQE